MPKCENCQNYNVKDFHINNFTRLEYDNCETKKRLNESKGPGDYKLSNYHSCNCSAPEIEKISQSQPKVYYKDGDGWVGMDGCMVDKDSELRITKGNKLTHSKYSNKQLFTRPYLSVPYMGKGVGNPCIETTLKPGEDTSQHKPCNVLSGNTRNNNFIPLIPHLKNNIQNPEHIIPDSALPGWVRGGLPSRQIIRNLNYLGNCGELYEQ